jgi:hypothetical protein
MDVRKIAIDALRYAIENIDGIEGGTDIPSYVIRACAREAIGALEADMANGVEPASDAIITALRFYANGSHFEIDDELQEFDTVSGEGDNWLFSGKDNDTTMIEDGGIARRALQGKPLLWIDGGEDETPKPIDGEVAHTAPQPAVNAEQAEELARLRGEAGVLRDLLKAANEQITITINDNDMESDEWMLLTALSTKIDAALRGAV